MIKGAHQHASNDTINNATKGMQDYLKTGINCFIQRTKNSTPQTQLKDRPHPVDGFRLY
jgi:hypothetical protein